MFILMHVTPTERIFIDLK